MKKTWIIFPALVGLLCFSAAYADSAAENLYKTRCQGCHGADGGKAPANGVEPLKGQSAADIEKKLTGYQDGNFGGPSKQVMERIAKGLSGDEVKTIADYASGL